MSRVLPKISGKNRAKQRFFALLPCAAAGGGVCEYHQAFFRPPDGSSYSAYITIYRNTARSPARPGRQGASMQKNTFSSPAQESPEKTPGCVCCPPLPKGAPLLWSGRRRMRPAPTFYTGFGSYAQDIVHFIQFSGQNFSDLAAYFYCSFSLSLL